MLSEQPGAPALPKIAAYLISVVAAVAMLVGTALFYRPNLGLIATVVAASVIMGVYLGGKRGSDFAVCVSGLFVAIAATTWLTGYYIAQGL